MGFLSTFYKRVGKIWSKQKGEIALFVELRSLFTSFLTLMDIKDHQGSNMIEKSKNNPQIRSLISERQGKFHEN